MTVYVAADRDGGNCCMTSEICCFRSAALGPTFGNWKAEGKTIEEAWNNLLDKVEKFHWGEEEETNVNATGVFYRYFYFKSPCNYDGSSFKEYEYKELREQLLKRNNVIHLGEHINANTGNKLDAYLWIIHKEKNTEEDDD